MGGHRDTLHLRGSVYEDTGLLCIGSSLSKYTMNVIRKGRQLKKRAITQIKRTENCLLKPTVGDIVVGLANLNLIKLPVR